MDSPYSKQPHTVQPQPGSHPGAYYGNPGNPYGQSGNPYGHQQQQTTNNTTIILQQPAAAGIRDWSSGICDCCDDMGICLCGIFCGICLAMRVSGDMDETMCLPWCVPNFLMALRVKLRTQEHIQGTICNDCLIQTYCGTCALCQLAREVKMIKQRGAHP